MNSEIPLNLIGQTLMEGRDNTPIGEDAEKDFSAFHESLQYFHLEWLREEILKTRRNQTEKKIWFNDYVLALKKLAVNNGNCSELQIDEKENHAKLIIHTVPEIHVVVEGTQEEPQLVISNGHYIFIHYTKDGLHPSELVSLFSDIDTKLKERSKDIIISGLKELVPGSLRECFISGKFTKDMGHSIQYDNSFSIGHEIRLRATETHDMAYAYIPDYFWNPQNKSHALNNLVYSYWALSEISARLPENVEFICQHRNDCGVTFTNDNPDFDRDEYFRRRAVLMVRRDQERNRNLKKDDYMYIMVHCGLNEKFSLRDFIIMCNSDNIKLQNHKQNIESRLGSYAEKVTIVFETDSISIYFLKDRQQEWTRECFLRFPYDSDLHFLKDIGFFMEKSKELVSVFNKSMDFETSVGLLRSWNS
ncbi:MAG: hypothetical protein IJ928_03420 [Prevotella sp.]|nr:hypothetical protein [Prevotella sp.]